MQSATTKTLVRAIEDAEQALSKLDGVLNGLLAQDQEVQETIRGMGAGGFSRLTDTLVEQRQASMDAVNNARLVGVEVGMPVDAAFDSLPEEITQAANLVLETFRASLNANNKRERSARERLEASIQYNKDCSACDMLKTGCMLNVFLTKIDLPAGTIDQKTIDRLTALGRNPL